MKPICLLMIAMLAGCTTTTGNDANLYGSAYGQRVVGNEAYVTVSNVWNEMDALPLADKHCKQFNRAARFKGMTNARAIFDCI